MLNGFLSEEASYSDSRGEPDDKPKVTHGEPKAPDQSTNENPTKLPLCRLLRWIAFVMAFFRVFWFDLRWKTKGVNIKLSAPLEDNMTFLPAAWMVFTNAIMISMWWVAMCLSMRHERWQDFNSTQGPTLQLLRERPIRKPPDKRGRQVGEDKDGQRMLADIIERERNLGTKKPLFVRVFRRVPTGTRRRFMLLALQAAATIAAAQPDITLSENKALRNCLRAYKRDGVMLTGKIKEQDRLRLIQVLEDLPQGLLAAGDSLELIVDTGCTKTGTGYVEDFVPGTLKALDQPILMDGIAGGLEITKAGVVRYEVLDDTGELQVIEADAYYIPSLNCRLFSPQSYFRQLQKDGKDPGEKAGLHVKHNGATMIWPNEARMSILYDRQTHLPRVRAYKNALKTADTLALTGCVTEESNQNLTAAQKLLLRWHFRLGHIGFATVQWLGRQGLLGPHGEKMGAASLDAPKCAACQFGKQGRTPIPTHHSTKDEPGSLTKEKLEPGQLIFSDQYESRLPGRAFTSKGYESSSLKYGGGTLFIDAASGFIFASHQVGQTAAETIESKMRFEREALTAGVTVQAYHTDNGVFTSKEFMRELGEKGQGMTLSGVSAQFQNGPAENGIKIVVRNARTMMLHTALRWPGFAERELWPMALSHAVHLYNTTPKQATGVSPVTVFTRTTQDPQALRNAHPWGCPVYVLQPKLKDGKKIPKWEPRSRRGQYMGISPMHASTVGLVRNLQTGTITPQFHMVYDDFFETVHSDAEREPKEWSELLQFSRFQSDYDEEANVPELEDEWVSPDELHSRELRRAQERADILEGRNRAQNQVPVATQGDQNQDQDGEQPNQAAPDRVTGAPTANSRGRRTRAPPATMPRAADPEPEVADVGTAPQPRVRPTRTRTAIDRFGSKDLYDKYYGAPRTAQAVANLCKTTAQSMVRCAVGQESDYRYLLALLTDVDTGALDGIHPGINQFPMALKAAYGKDPDSPTYSEAMGGADREQYEEAMVKEIQELEQHKTWVMMPKSKVPTNAKVLPSTWVFRLKRYPDGRARKHKARFCVRGDRQVEGVDYTEKYSPVVSWSTVRMLLSLSLSQDLCSRQVDFSNAFVQAELSSDEHIYVALPKGFEMSGEGDEEQVLKLRRSLYGLVQAPLYWGNHLKAALEAEGLKQSVSDPCMFIGDGMVTLTYVDDVLFFGRDSKKIDAKIKAIEARGFKLTIEEDVYAFLGVEVIRLPNGEIEMKQSGLIAKVLATCGMTACHAKATPSNQVPLGTDVNGEPVTGKFDYASAVGMLMYLSSNSRPDIQYAVHQCARFTHFPRKSHEDAICRICRYLQGTKDKGLRFKPEEDLKLDCYVDADFAGLYGVEDSQDPVCVKSRTGYCLTLGGCPLIWVSKLQTEVALSTTEAEYIALSQSMRDLIPMRRLLREAGKGLGLDFSKPAVLHSTVFEDNNGALSLALTPKMTPRTKHIAVKYHHFRESVGPDKGIDIVKIDTNLQKADIFTKGLAADKHQSIRTLLMGW